MGSCVARLTLKMRRRLVDQYAVYNNINIMPSTMEVLRVLLGQSIATSMIIGLILATSIPLAIVPLTRFLKRRQRSINSFSYRQLDKPDDYIFVVTQTIVMSGTATGVWLHIAANNDNILWSLVDATPATIIKTFIGCFFLREFFGYWSHRFFHSKLLYKRVSSRSYS